MEIFEIPVAKDAARNWSFTFRKQYHTLPPMKNIWKQVGDVVSLEVKYKSRYFVKLSAEYYNGMVEIKAVYPDGHPFILSKIHNVLTAPSRAELKTLVKSALIINKGR